MAIRADEANLKRSYEDFEPFCRWKVNEEERQILEVNVQGFYKEQLRVHVKSCGILRISGEQPVDETKWRRFNKEIKLAKDCDSDKIHAKLTRSGFLVLTIPKKTSTSRAISMQADNDQQTEEKIQTEQDASSSSSGLRNAMLRLKPSREMTLNMVLVSAILVIVGVGSYVSWKYLTTAPPTDED
ncbi:hypothetical protein FNV43_RR15165 [Rhamnella rubrinervis]|uniref:SHSP domain-containing protein n=1 Tax=Rhamnella rubrinervis TaxID=2594499 RepID=A0A8K0E873_9ROSA|nr:hypothetical protein FNV43_RR15081 [Rhamnella rubrinervis]KAF3441252.1 hypothetical protein FNV43_RR15165 [Rhamnella rubrinervis]